ncbi:hypothetical protein ACG83_41695, partial [Frankia sp. R43]|uniref:hypothetical protein n=1 Tax=Frankia sp. R43 TaxID=269536 RepID=UPI0006DA9232
QLREQYPLLPSLGTETLAELRTIDQLVNHLTTPDPTTANGTSPATHHGGAPADGPDGESLRAAVVAMVATRTGYTAEMIDPSMDMEAD